MIALTLIALVPWLQASTPSASDSWESLTQAYRKAFEERHQKTSRDPSLDLPMPEPEYQERFLALAEGGEFRATLWLLAHFEEQHAARLLTVVEAAGENGLLPTAMHGLARHAGSFETARLAELFERHLASATAPDVRAVAALALARIQPASEQVQARDLLVWAAMTYFRGVDLAPGEALAPEDLDELAVTFVEKLAKESGAHFQRAYYKGPDNIYFPLPDAPADPDELWRPAMEELARRGARKAQFWALENAPWELDAAAKERLKGYFTAFTSAPFAADELADFGYQINSLVYRLGIEVVEPGVRRLIELSPEGARAGLLFGLGTALCEAAGEDKAKTERGLALLTEVKERWPTSDQAKSAEGRLFRYTKLAIGEVCPDFETVDADGNAFKLSDYKGKVTVIDFWGFW